MPGHRTNDAARPDGGIASGRSPLEVPHHGSLRTTYDALWRDGRTALSSGNIDVDPLPIEGGPRWGISAVFRLTAWSEALTRAASRIAALAGARTVVYGPHNLHITIQQFEGHRTVVPAADPSLRDRRTALADIACQLGPMTIALRGLTASASGVQIQGWPAFDLQALRTRLHHAVDAAGSPVSGPEASSSALRSSAHATLAIFGRTVDHGVELSDYVEAHRATDFGTIAVDALWLVGYARTERSVRLIEYGRFPVGGRAAPPR